MNKWKRLIKTISWRLVATITTFFITYMITGAIVFATSIALTEVFIKMLMYYIHELIWDYFIKLYDSNTLIDK